MMNLRLFLRHIEPSSGCRRIVDVLRRFGMQRIVHAYFARMAASVSGLGIIWASPDSICVCLRSISSTPAFASKPVIRACTNSARSGAGSCNASAFRVFCG